MANNKHISHGQQVREKLLQEIINYIQLHGYPPTILEMMKLVGLKSRSSIQSHIVKMLDAGILETDAELTGSARAIRVPRYKFVKEEDAKRMVPMAVNVKYFGSQEIIVCPSCKKEFTCDDWGEFNFCYYCGQAFDVLENRS